MNRLDKLFKGSFYKSIDSVFLRNLATSPDQDIINTPYNKSDLVFTCVSTTARAISQVPLKVMAKTKMNTWEWMGEQDPIQILLDKPNSMTSSSEEFIAALVSYLLLDGHVFVVPFPPTGKYFDSLWVVKRTNMNAVKDERTGQILYWKYTPNNNISIPLFIDEVGSIKFLNPYDPIWGMSPLESGRLSLLNDYKASDYTSRFWDQGAVPGGVLETEKNLTEDRVERIRKQFSSDHGGSTKAHRVAVLEGGLKYHQVGLTQKDMEFVELKKYSRDSILQIFGMKKAVISITENLNYATAKEERKEWWQDTNLPLMKMIESALGNILFPNDPNTKVVFDISGVESLHEDYTKRVEIGEILLKIGFTANEINEKLELGFHPKPWRDKWYMPVNMIPITEDGPEPIPGIGGTPPMGTPTLPASDNNTPKLPPPPKQIKEFVEESIDEVEDKQHQVLWKSIVGKTEPLEMEFLSKVRRCFFEMRKKVLQLLNQKSEHDVLNENFIKQKNDLMKWSVPIYEKSVRTGAETLASEIGTGLDFSLNDPDVLQYLISRPLKVVGVVDTIKNQIANDIHIGMGKNESINQIAGRIKNNFARANDRAMTIARTEVGSSLSFGRNKAMSKSPFTKKIWITAGDEVVRDTHKRMNNTKTDIGKPWTVGGYQLKYPADYNGPGKEVINCRCIEIVDPSSRVAPATPVVPNVTTDEAVPVASPQWVNQSTMDEAISRLRKVIPDVIVQIKKADINQTALDAINAIGRSVSESRENPVFDEFFSRKPLRKIVLKNVDKYEYEYGGNKIFADGSYDPFNRKLILAIKGKIYDSDWKAVIPKEGMVRFTASSRGGVGIFDHEMGHHLYYGKLLKSSTMKEQWQKYFESNKSTLGRSVSKYAQTNSNEAFAESWSLYASNMNKSLLPQEITNFFDKLLKIKK
jgi:HK97 family phage portal protein